MLFFLLVVMGICIGFLGTMMVVDIISTNNVEEEKNMVVKRAKKKVLVPPNIKLSNVHIDVVGNGYIVHAHYQYDQAGDETRYDQREFVFDTWGDVCDFLKKLNELVTTFKVTKYVY